MPRLCEAVREKGVSTEIISLRERRDRAEISEAPNSGVRWVECSTHRYFPVGWPGHFKQQLRIALNQRPHSILHDAGIWLPSNRCVAQVARELRVPRVVSPRGMLSEWALNHGSVWKKLAWRVYQKRDLESASLLHATAESEAAEFRQCGLRPPIAVVPNGVDVPPAIRRQTGEERRERVALFLSRLHPKKGLLDLVEAWAAVRPKGWRLVIAGDDEGGHRATVERAAAERGIGDRIDFLGAVADADKWDLYAKADLFVLPSYSENFGIVVAEALAAGVPVITTRATPWKEIQELRCGWWVDTGAASLATALRHATGKSDEERREMGERGRELMESKYSWDVAAEKMIACYHWILGKQEKPEWVQLS